MHILTFLYLLCLFIILWSNFAIRFRVMFPWHANIVSIFKPTFVCLVYCVLIELQNNVILLFTIIFNTMRCWNCFSIFRCFLVFKRCENYWTLGSASFLLRNLGKLKMRMLITLLLLERSKRYSVCRRSVTAFCMHTYKHWVFPNSCDKHVLTMHSEQAQGQYEIGKLGSSTVRLGFTAIQNFARLATSHRQWQNYRLTLAFLHRKWWVFNLAP